MKLSTLFSIVDQALGEYGDMEVKTQAQYEMGLCDPAYDPVEIAVCSTNRGNILMINFYGYNVLLDNKVDIGNIQRCGDAWKCECGGVMEEVWDGIFGLRWYCNKCGKREW